MRHPLKIEMLTEGSEGSSKIGKVHEVKLKKPKFLMCSSMSWIEDGDFPEWLLVELLIRLPVKSVFQFKLVSKQWFSVISKPYFVRAYVSRASLFSQPWTVVSLFLSKDYQGSQVLEYGMLEDLYPKPSLGVVCVPRIHQPEDIIYMAFGVSNGLVLYGLSDYIIKRNYYICNPLTGHCVSLPQLSCKFTFCWGFVTCVENDALKSYRVVLVEPPIEGSSSIRFHVCVSNIGEWKDFTVPCNLFPLVIKKAAATDLNGVLHWIAEGHCIIAYDPYKKPNQMRIIALPVDTLEVSERQTAFQSLCVAYKGKLRYFESSNRVISGNVFLSFRVWVLNDYCSGDWCLQHNVSHEDIQYDANFPSRGLVMEPIYFHPFDSEIVYLGCADVGELYNINIKTRELRVEDEFFRHAGNVWKRMFASMWIISHPFVIPHWPVSIPMEPEG